MNKLFIGLLIVAAGAGIIFFLYKKKNAAKNDIKKEWIVGKWKIDSISPGKDPEFVFLLYATDSNSKKEVHHFYDDGMLITSHPYDSILMNDSSFYEFSKNNELLFKGNRSDSISTAFFVTKLTQESLQLQAKDSTMILLTKEK